MRNRLIKTEDNMTFYGGIKYKDNKLLRSLNNVLPQIRNEFFFQDILQSKDETAATTSLPKKVTTNNYFTIPKLIFESRTQITKTKTTTIVCTLIYLSFTSYQLSVRVVSPLFFAHALSSLGAKSPD